MLDAQIAAPSAAPATESAPLAVESFNSTERETWLRTGETPTRTDAPADSSTAKPVDQAVSTETRTPADSEPAKRSDPRATENRIPELLAERAAERARADALQRELDALRRPQSKDAHADSSPAPVTEPDYKRFLKLPDAPKLEAFDTVEEHTAAMSLFIADKRYEERAAQQQQAEAQTQRERSIEERESGFRERITAAIKADPTFPTKVIPEVRDLMPVHVARAVGQPITALNALADEFLTNPNGPALMLHFSDHPDELRRFAGLSVAEFFRELGRVEAQMTAPPQTLPPTTKTLTDAPEPPTTLGKKAAESADEASAALARGDFATYQRVTNARELARK